MFLYKYLSIYYATISNYYPKCPVSRNAISPGGGARTMSVEWISPNVSAVATPMNWTLKALLPGGACHPANRCGTARSTGRMAEEPFVYAAVPLRRLLCYLKSSFPSRSAESRLGVLLYTFIIIIISIISDQIEICQVPIMLINYVEPCYIKLYKIVLLQIFH